VDQLEIGQKTMSIFSLIDFEPNKHLTLCLNKTRTSAFEWLQEQIQNFKIPGFIRE